MWSTLKTRRPPPASVRVAAGTGGGGNDAEDPRDDLARAPAEVEHDEMVHEAIGREGIEGEEAGAPPGRKQAAGQRQPGRPAACRDHLSCEGPAEGGPEADDGATVILGGEHSVREGAEEEELDAAFCTPT